MTMIQEVMWKSLKRRRLLFWLLQEIKRRGRRRDLNWWEEAETKRRRRDEAREMCIKHHHHLVCDQKSGEEGKERRIHCYSIRTGMARIGWNCLRIFRHERGDDGHEKSLQYTFKFNTRYGMEKEWNKGRDPHHHMKKNLFRPLTFHRQKRNILSWFRFCSIFSPSTSSKPEHSLVHHHLALLSCFPSLTFRQINQIFCSFSPDLSEEEKKSISRRRMLLWAAPH